MRIPWRRPPKPEPRRAPNPTAIAVLEHDLLGIQPEPGTMAALTIALRKTGTCLNHQPIDVSQISDPKPVGLCTQCGKHMVRDAEGNWVIA